MGPPGPVVSHGVELITDIGYIRESVDATDLDFGRRKISCSRAPGALQSLRFFDPTYGGRASTGADTVSN